MTIERPILFSTPMVQAILDNQKTQTRRIINPQPKALDMPLPMPIDQAAVFLKQASKDGYTNLFSSGPLKGLAGPACRYGQVGDILWVRETWCKFVDHHATKDQQYAYKADCGSAGEDARQDYIKAGWPYQWRPSIHMPKAAARIFLQITDVRAERLQMISTEDVYAEGVGGNYGESGKRLGFDGQPHEWDNMNAQESFQWIWAKINGSESWESNPFVWVVSFSRIDKKP
ncbi:hypothetical protein [Larkinella sp. C7]|uniref:hypothetical protein n=1 Tax=Larkinella sp. C7 TaxID=2576607 RepID=UPI0011113DD4|nr:hypothetical protein [Larkinella sp. C7]